MSSTRRLCSVTDHNSERLLVNVRVLYSVPPDYPEHWKRWTKRFRGKGSAKRKKILRIANKSLVVFFVALYLLLAMGCLGTTPAAIIAYVAATATCFVLAGLLRAWLNMPRPYEVFDLKPLVPKKDLKSGRSFPSRHTFSAFLIATMAALIFQSFASVVILLLAAALGATRVFEGVHFLRDVIAGAVLGILCGLICLAVLVVGVV